MRRLDNAPSSLPRPRPRPPPLSLSSEGQEQILQRQAA